jgi:hypothetical protein
LNKPAVKTANEIKRFSDVEYRNTKNPRPITIKYQTNQAFKPGQEMDETDSFLETDRMNPGVKTPPSRPWGTSTPNEKKVKSATPVKMM